MGKEMEGQREMGKRTRQRQGRKEEGQKERRSSNSAQEKKKKNLNFLVATVKHFLVGGNEAEKSKMLGWVRSKRTAGRHVCAGLG